MPLDKLHFEYPNRRYGMDHDRYAWSMLTDRKQVAWPNGNKLALWINVGLQFFPMNPQGKPVKIPGGMTMPYPDLRHFSLRDYGNRVGIYRMLEAFDRYKVKPTFAMNAQVAERYPYLVETLRSRGDEIIGHSWNMDTAHAGGLAPEEEKALVARSLDRLRILTGQKVRGWVSPGRLNSPITPDLLAEHGIEYFCDWVNDDMPYPFHTRAGDLWAMPLPTELEDRLLIVENFHSEQSYAEQMIDAATMLLAEAQTQGGRILGLSVHPWVLGQPHRIKYFEQVLAAITAMPSVWSASAGEILDAFKAQAA